MIAEPPGPRHAGRRAFARFGLPTLLLLGVVALPLASGERTLILRDVLQVHLASKAAQAAAYEQGYFPVIDAYRAGGQPMTGNPNTLPFYPGNLLYLAASPLWALNAHFWLHLLLGPLAGYALGRAWGLPPPAAWAAGACYALSGFFLSHLSFYNLVAGAAWSPLLAAAAVRARAGRRWAAPIAGVLWALILVSGDPTTAVFAALLAGGAFLAAPGAPAAGGRAAVQTAARLASAVGLGTLVALPQIVELLRVLPATLRGYRGYADWRLTVGSFEPLQAVEWLVPTAFGRFELAGRGGFWGHGAFGGEEPFFLSLHPGLLALALVAASGRPRSRAAWWGWASVLLGVFLALGGHNPLVRLLLELPGGGILRFPVKAWLLVAAGASLLAGIGFGRVFPGTGGAPGEASPGTGPRLRRLGWPLAALAALLAGVLLVLIAAPARFDAWIVAHARAGWTVELAAAERARWLAVLTVLMVLAAALAACLALARRRPAVAAALLLAVHGAGQLHLLRGLRVTDEAAFYREPPPLLAAVPQGATVVDAGYARLFGSPPAPRPPDSRPFWRIRHDYLALAPFAGVLHGYPYELDRSPEGLYSFLLRVAGDAVRAAPGDADRVRALARWGVGAVVSPRSLAVSPEQAAPAARWQGLVAPVHVYRLRGPVPEVRLAERPLRVPHLNAAWKLFRSPGFDPARHAVLPGREDDPVPRLEAGEAVAPGRVRVERRSPESLDVTVDSPAGGVLVVQRSFLPIWRVTVDGQPAALEVADLYRIGVEVPPGRHRVRLWVDRGPLVLAGWASGLGLAGLLGWASAGLRRRDPRESVEIEGSAQDV